MSIDMLLKDGFENLSQFSKGLAIKLSQLNTAFVLCFFGVFWTGKWWNVDETR